MSESGPFQPSYLPAIDDRLRYQSGLSISVGLSGRCHARDQVGSNPLDDTSPAADRLADPDDSDALTK
jgi:hypothetical protein